ncbi:MAG TPA: prepilin-type N-terminal cleavage/methylation domain-containing protein [Candidatus Omnitrophota bacterium]|nr:prepilin-type N-terminal cleavage/methylation domain-containing protein [Candidatus Omnitrophota bacterium]HSA30398.1 prepilin-type N-terminal cleavage/methylation domain-containing protein [Candidatus Omnitrophota bacterium]
MKTTQGFTLLELIIVIIIVGVLASIALPKLFSVVEGSRAAEALAAISSIRSSMERCYLMSNGTYFGCQINTYAPTNDSLDIENPEKSPGAHFRYLVTSGAPFTRNDYVIISIRNAVDGGTHQGKMINFGLGARARVNADQVSYTLEYVGDDKIYWDASDIYKGLIPKSN